MLVVAVVALAYGSAAPQVAVAEFAPTAQENIDAPPTTAADTNAGPSAGRPGRTTTTVPPITAAVADPTGNQAVAPTTRTARTRACIGTPPRQTEDPMSPPCMTAIFEGDNGGNTSRGVTATEIKVALPVWSGITTDPSYQEPLTALIEYFNQRYELYGRRIVPVYVPAAPTDALTSRAIASDIVSRNVFATVTGPQEWNYPPQPAMANALARARIITIARGASAWWSDRTLYDQLHPYLWSTYPSSEDTQLNLADLACAALAGRKAANAGDDPLRSATRKFGIVAAGQEAPPRANLLQERLAACTGQNPSLFGITSVGGMTTEAWRTGFNRFRSEGVTTVFCLCEYYYATSATSEAHAASYHPEWILTPTQQATGHDESWLQGRRTSNQIAPPIRLSAGPRLLPLQARPWFQAIQSVRPGALTSTSNVTGRYSMAEFMYDQLLILVTGVQGAGPQLTPDTFAAGLIATQFSNPGAGQPPYWQPSAGFGPGDHSLYDDYAVAWWSDTAPALDQPVSSRATGSWCYLGGAARFQPGTYPADADSRLFNPAEPCR